MSNDTTSNVKLARDMSAILTRYTRSGQDYDEMNFHRACLTCEFQIKKFDCDKLFWAEIWKYLEPIADVQTLKEIYANLQAIKDDHHNPKHNSCDGWSGQELLDNIAKHLIPVVAQQ